MSSPMDSSSSSPSCRCLAMATSLPSCAPESWQPRPSRWARQRNDSTKRSTATVFIDFTFAPRATGGLLQQPVRPGTLSHAVRPARLVPNGILDKEPRDFSNRVVRRGQGTSPRRCVLKLHIELDVFACGVGITGVVGELKTAVV